MEIVLMDGCVLGRRRAVGLRERGAPRAIWSNPRGRNCALKRLEVGPSRRKLNPGQPRGMVEVDPAPRYYADSGLGGHSFLSFSSHFTNYCIFQTFLMYLTSYSVNFIPRVSKFIQPKTY